MSYLLSCLNIEPLEQASSQVLCYYINITEETQILYVMNESDCDFECTAFPKERILFTALPESYLNINSSRVEGKVLKKIPCKLLNIHQEVS